MLKLLKQNNFNAVLCDILREILKQSEEKLCYVEGGGEGFILPSGCN